MFYLMILKRKSLKNYGKKVTSPLDGETKGGIILRSGKGYEEGLHNAMLKAKIEYIAKTPKSSINLFAGDYVEELEYYKGDIPGLKKYLKTLGFRIIREYDVDESHWFELNKNIHVSEEGFVIKEI